MEHEVSSVAVLDGLSKEKYVLVGDIVSVSLEFDVLHSPHELIISLADYPSRCEGHR